MCRSRLKFSTRWTKAGRSVLSTPTIRTRATPIGEMFGNPMFDLKDPAGILMEINSCRKTYPNHYIRVTAFSAVRGVESVTMSYIVNRPKKEPGFSLVRQETDGRTMRYSIHSYATDKPEGERY